MRLGTYKGIHVKKPAISVSEAEIDRVLKKKQHANAVVRTIDEGDTVRHETEYQPIDDDFAKDFSKFETLAQWRAAIGEQLRIRHERSAEKALTRELLGKIIADSDIPIDPDLKEELAMELYEDFLYTLEENGMTLQTYCKRSGFTKEQIQAAKEAEAKRSMQEQSILHAIADKEGLAISDEEQYEAMCELAAEDGEDVDVWMNMLEEEEIESIADQLRMNKAMCIILEHAILD